MYNSTRVDDGLWHRIRATRLDQTASLMVIMMVAKTMRMMMHSPFMHSYGLAMAGNLSFSIFLA